LPPASAILIKFNDAVVEIYTCSSDAGRDAPFRCTRSILVAKLAALSQQRLQGVGWRAGWLAACALPGRGLFSQSADLLDINSSAQEFISRLCA
jgi:hypothetical protein